MNVLVACEFSGVVRDAFLAKGHNAWSCDLMPSESDIRTNHLQGDVRFYLGEWEKSSVGWAWDLMIAHPDCTYLTISAEWAYKNPDQIDKNLSPDKLYGGARLNARKAALDFIRFLWNQKVKRKCIENPVGVINTEIGYMPKPQYIQPHQFGHDASKKTGLWLENLPPLVPTKNIEPRIVNGLKRWSNQTDSGQNKLPPSKDRSKIRSRTYSGIADAMADQWG